MTYLNARPPVAVSNMNLPPEGPQCVPVPFDFGVQSAINLDMTQLTETNKISYFQGMYVDNSASSAPISFYNSQTNQTVTVPGGYQAYIPILSGKQTKLLVSSASAAIIVVSFYNIPIQPLMWNSVQGATKTDANGYMLVSDPALDAATNGDIIRTQLVTNIADVASLTGTITSAAATTIVTSAVNYFLSWVDLEFSADAAMAAAGYNTWQVLENGAPIMQGKVWLPAASAVPTAPTRSIEVFSKSGLNYKSQTVGNLALKLGTALTAGAFYYNIGATAYTYNS